ncbi:lipoprotein [Paenibacillus puerhi]|uniref:lipoprotein n=1 Tax=Paenibacillus puerhi TaxID=2692622 RepID=UPI001359F8FF|nr:lipoprotein [Paenibacillus puerhi]
MKRSWLRLLALLLTLALAGCSLPAAGGGEEPASANLPKKLLLLKKKEGSGDGLLVKRWEKQGYLVFEMSENEFKADQTAGYAAIYVSESVNAARLDSGLTKLALPVVYAKPQLAGTSGVAEMQGYGQLEGVSKVAIRQMKHPLAAGLTEQPAVYQSAGKLNYAVPSKEAVVIAAAADDEKKAVLFAYEKGSRNALDQPVPARQVFVFLPTGDEANLTEDGWKLLDAALAWAVQNPTK